ncbi:MAG: DMT family transporter [Pseudomonadota bacterium]
MTASSPIHAAGLMVCAGAFFAISNTVVQFCTMVAGMPTTTVAFWQYVIAFLFTLPWLVSNGLKVVATRRFGRYLVQVLFAAAGIQFWVLGLAYVPIWQAIALALLMPFFVTLGSAVFLGESVDRGRWAAVIVAFAGGMIILAPWSESFTLFAVLPALAAASWAIASLLMKQLTDTESPAKITFYVLLLLAPMNGLLGLGAGGLTVAPHLWIYVIAAGLLVGLGQYTLASAYSRADASFLQPFDHLKLPLNVTLGILVFGFIPPGSMLIGSLMIIGASAYMLRQDHGHLAS